MQHPPLTKRQKQILDFINLSIKQNGYAPSLEEIKQHFKLKAISTVHEHLENLKSKGLIQKGMNQARGIQVNDDYDSNSIIIPIEGQIGSQLSKKDKNIDNFRISGKNLKAFAIIDDTYSKFDINHGDTILIDANAQNGDSDLVLVNENKQLIITTYSPEKPSIIGKITFVVRSL